MRKTIAALLSGLLATAVLGGCSSNLPETPSSSEQESSSTPSSSTPAPESSQAPAETQGYSLGLAVDSTTEESKSAQGENGMAKTDSRAVAVLVDENGKIVECIIDGVQSTITFDAGGRVTANRADEIKTKQELGPDYGMAKASSIGKEWNEQADALAAWMKGKNIDEVRGIAVNEEGAPTDAELAASVTISIAGYLETVEKAIRNAVPTNARSGDTLGLGIRTTIDKSANAEGNKEGLAQTDSSYVAAAFGEDGKVTGCVIDGSQSNINFDTTGKITSDPAQKHRTKNELGTEYGMGKASSIGKEWNQQAAAYAAYILGKTVDEVKGIAVNEKGAPTEEELTASVTISVGNFNIALEKAAARS